MRPRRPARILAPLAIAAAAVALVVVIQGSGGKEKSSAPSGRSAPAGRRSAAPAKPRPASKGRTYVVREGDILSSISVKSGVPVATLEELNPNADPQALHAGQRLKLRP